MRLDRRAAVARFLRRRSNELVITGLGSPSFDVAAAGDSPLNFYLWGAMGAAAMAGLGLALAQPKRRVLVITGDGEMLMALGSLATIGCEKPDNLSIVVLDNERYGETGMQPSHSGRGTDLAAVAQAAGFPKTYTIWTENEIDDLAKQVFTSRGLVFATIKVSADPGPVCLPPRDGAYLRSRFREALLGPDAHT
ncbi:MAG TPA: thiamine pyrophosphate-dependent enzyme [Terriglobales bacterium]|nr:thiamine pyrophosphate-dependent enzyme [Terriglobales bacterium]HXY16413.1 thiamine pyrophosphate-dependent enzyme [Terriglobales bacterium]